MTQTQHEANTFSVQLDFYWQSVAVYAVTLICYVIIRALYFSQLQEGLLVVVVNDPVVVVLGLFVALSVIALVVEMIMDRVIIIGPDFITFVNRFHERTFTSDEIDRIIIGKDRRVRVRPTTPIIRLYIKERRRPLRIRPALSDRENELVSAVLALRHNHSGNAL
ncbi:MAG: hypothetical protein ACK475_03955 [Bacteroidota bacterium]|jgi:hypothetical protein